MMRERFLSSVVLAFLSSGVLAFLPSVVLAIATIAGANVAHADEISDAKKALAEHGIRVSRSGVILSDESKFSQALKGVFRTRRELNGANKELASAERQELLGNQKISQLTKYNVVLNSQLATVNPNNVSKNNRLVGAINANIGQIRLLHEQSKQFDDHLKSVRGKANEAREKYIQTILQLREDANGITNQYAALSVDTGVKDALEKYNQAAGKQLKILPSRGFKTTLRQLVKLEDTVLSETIELRSEGNTFYVSVVIDGKHTQEMIVDSGASLISLPKAIATKCGITISSTDPEITLSLADGSQIKGTLVKIREVRVGKFSVKNVECAVLEASAVNAPALLGMSFLGKFKFELNAQKSNMTMVKVETQ